jgi:5-(carboxyamino)imidazole ribonucleotide synthase
MTGTTAPVLPPAMLGMLGGGQLGRYFVQAAHDLGYRVTVLDPDAGSPAGRIADRHLVAAYDDRQAIDELAGTCAAVSTEFENVPAATLEALASLVPVRPSATAVAACQDRRREKAFVTRLGLPCGPYAVIESSADLDDLPDDLFPGILKAARLGYDGKGQTAVPNRAAITTAWDSLGRVPAVLEAKLPLDCEVSVILARDAGGATAVFPVTENRHRRGILDVSIAPARVPGALAQQARECALGIAEGLSYIGTLGVEFFVSGGRLYVNEMAPRPHNSGHYTLDACRTTQYEQQVRALCGLRLGDPSPVQAAVMVNLLGDLWFAPGSNEPREPDWLALTSEPGLRLRLYGKQAARPGRKMGHFTVLADDVGTALARALAARARIGIRDD